MPGPGRYRPRVQPSVVSRRSFLGDAVVLAAPAVGSLPLRAAGEAVSDRKVRVVCVGGHPDDPESGAAGTLARYAGLGHRVTVIYLTRGERGIRGKSLDEAARIRSAECGTACRILGARAVFFGQIDGATEFNHTQVDAMKGLLEVEKADIVITHWPIDNHMDHQVASLLAIRACMAMAAPKPRLYFFEVNTGSQSQGFQPNVYVDVSSVLEQKKQALLAHESQGGAEIWREHHEVIALWRGREAGVAAAEAFCHLDRNSQTDRLPGI